MTQADDLFEQKKGLVPFAIEQKYGSYHKANQVAKKNNMELSDLLQVGFTALWRLCQSYDPAKDDSFNGYVIKTIKLRVQEELHIRGLPIKTTTWCSSAKRNSFAFFSIDQQEQPEEFLRKASDTRSAETIALQRLYVEEALRGLSDKEKNVLLLHFQGYQDKEIAELLGYSYRTAASRAKKLAMKKLNPDYQFSHHIVHKRCYKKSGR